MHRKIILTGLILYLLAYAPFAPAQSNVTFDVQAYKNFLASHRDLTADQLRALYPAATFRNQLALNLAQVTYLDSINKVYKLTGDELALLGEHGFVVSERLSQQSFGQAYLEIYKNDLPVFVSTDALLHALHKSYDAILQQTEMSLLIPRLQELLLKMYGAWPSLYQAYAARPEMRPMLNDVEVYLNVALQLLGAKVAPYRAENLATINQLLALISAEQPADYPLFSETPRRLDFSQFRPRGHYTDFEELRRYFKTMIWLGRTELLLTKPKVPGGRVPSDADIRRQTIAAFLLLESTKNNDALKIWQEIDGIIRFLVGESDNVTLPHLQLLAGEMGLTKADELLGAARLQNFKNALAAKAFAMQRINSQILMTDPFNAEQIELPSAFLLFGQRFVIDAYVMWNVVYDRIVHQGRKIFRELPSSLDVLFALGNDAAPILLKNDLAQYHYAPNAAALRYLVDSYEEDFWNGALYNVWLQAIRALNPAKNLSSLPAFMQTGAFWQQKMNTQLAAWAQLRHDNLLYAKQSYTGGVTCSFPHSFVEPFPAFYRALKNFAQQAQRNFANVNFAEPATRDWILRYFSHMAGVMDTLATVAEKELSRTLPNEAETHFLQRMLYARRFGCETFFDGWYPHLFFNGPNDCDASDLVVADVHTAPTDAAGNPVGHVMHAGTGPLDLGVFIAECHDGKPMAYVGPVMSYYEHVTTNFKRLTDGEWEELYQKPPSLRPAWVNVYLADASGKRRTLGPSLTTSIQDKPVANAKPANYLLHQNFPNPFSTTGKSAAIDGGNAGTVIRFEIPSSLANATTHLAIYNVRGELVHEFINRKLPAGNYLVRWEGKDNAGRDVASGIYLYRLQVVDPARGGAGSVMEMRKLSLVK